MGEYLQPQTVIESWYPKLFPWRPLCERLVLNGLCGRGASQPGALVALDLVDTSIRAPCLPGEIGPTAHGFDYPSNGIDLIPINIADLSFRSDGRAPGFDFAINRINIMPSAGRAPSVVFHTLHYLGWLEAAGVTIANGSRAHFTGASKTIQNGLFAGLGLHCPRAVAVQRVGDVLEAAETIGFPLIVKPNIGGSGSGISRYDTREQLEAAVASEQFGLGIDDTGLVQEYIRCDGFVYRVEILGSRLFYSIKQKMKAGVFNYCAADGCSVSSAPGNSTSAFDHCPLNPENRIQPFDAAPAIVEQATAVVRSAGADFGGVEYLMDTRTETPCFYDFNPYSNFVSNGLEMLGFSPEQRFVDFIKEVYTGQSANRSDERAAK